jgi:hypothetical protein
MGELRDHHVTAFVTGRAGDHLDGERRRWDPAMAEQIDGHVTVVYPDEAPRLELLRARLNAVGERTPPFPLVLGEVVAHEGRPARGVYHRVLDPVGVWQWMREFLLAPPFQSLEVRPHATVAHPRTSQLLHEAWTALGGSDPGLEFRVGELHLTATDGSRWVSLEQVRLTGGVAPP